MRKIQWLVVAFVCFAFAGCRSAEQKSVSELMPAREFSSKLKLVVWAQVHAVEEPWLSLLVGETPEDNPVKIPACPYWFVSAGSTSVSDLVAEAKAQHIPGIRLDFASDSDLAAVEALQGLEVLYLHNITDAGTAHIRRLKLLRALCLSYTEITDAGMANIKELRNLRYLNLGSTKITNAGLAQIACLTDLCSLSLSGTNITDAGLVHLKNMKVLHTLLLDDTAITDAGLVHLKELKSLRFLFLPFKNTDMTESGLSELRKALPNTTIYLEENLSSDSLTF